MEKISKLTSSVLASKNLTRAASAALVCYRGNDVLREMFDEDFIRKIEIISFKEGFLYIKTESSIYSQELKIKEKEFIGELNKILGKEIVKKLRFKN